MGIRWGLLATASGALVPPVRMTGRLGIGATVGDGREGFGPEAWGLGGSGPAVHQACRSLERGNPAPGGVAQRESRRGDGSDIEGLQSLLVATSASRSIRLSVAHWGVDVAAPGPGNNGRVLFHVSK